MADTCSTDSRPARSFEKERRVLILDDDRDLSIAWTEVLDSHGYSVVCAESADDAQKALANFDAQVAVVDVRLGLKNGLDAIPSLKRLQPNLVCVLVTAFADTDTAIRALDQGAVALLRKPLAPSELLSTLDRCYRGLELEEDKLLAEEALRCRNEELLKTNAVLAQALASEKNALRDKALSENRELAILEASFDPIICVDSSGLIRFSNRAVTRVCGWKPEELVGSHLRHLVPESLRSQFDDRLQTFIQDGARFLVNRPIELYARRRDGTEFPCEVAITRVDTGASGGELYVGIIRDLSARRQAESEQEELQARLRQSQKMDALGQLAGGVAHDFNNLLTVIMGNTELIRAQFDTPEAASIAVAAEHAAALTKQLLQFSRKSIHRPKVGELDAMVQDNSALLTRALREDIELIFSLGCGRSLVHADPGDIHQIVMNLCVNAQDAIKSSGTIKIKTALVSREESGVNSLGSPTGDFVELIVSDSGEGMDKETCSRALEPFFTTKPPGKGTGVGLSTVFGIAVNSGGFVDIQSHLGEGTSVSVFLPLVLGEPEKEVLPKPIDGSPGGSEVILVVEDDPQILGVVERVLREAGYQVIPSSNPDDAESLWSKLGGGIDLLLTDFLMPGRNGDELAARITSRQPALKLLFMSGFTPGSKLSSLFEEAALIQKPFTPRALLREVRRALDSGPTSLARDPG